MLLQLKYGTSKELQIFNGNVISKGFLQTCLDIFNPLIQQMAAEVSEG